MNSIGSIQLQQDVMWLNQILATTHFENTVRTLGSSIHVQRYAVGTRELFIGTVDDGYGMQGYFTYSQVLALRAYARSGSVVPFVYEGETINIKILESSLSALEPLVPRPNPANDDLYFGVFKAIEF